jgi:hypothetical protein
MYTNLGALTATTPAVSLCENWEALISKKESGTDTSTFDGYEFEGSRFHGTIKIIGEKSVSSKIIADIRVENTVEPTHTLNITVNSTYDAKKDDLIYFTLDGSYYCLDSSKPIEE